MKVALLGCGYWGRNLARNLFQLQALDVLCDPREEVLLEQRRLYPSVEFSRDFRAVLARPDLTAVVVAAPAELHHALVREAILAGKDVMVEKPLALRAGDGEELARLADERGVVLMVGHVLEYHPVVLRMRDLIEAGELGPIHYIYSSRLNLGRVRHEENILWSFAPHDISVVLLLLGRMPLRVSASGGSYLQPGVVDVTVTNLLFADGVRAHIFVSWLHPFKEQKFVVIGQRRMMMFDDLSRETKLRIYEGGIEWIDGVPLARKTLETAHYFPEAEPLRLECEHFLECVRTRRRPRSDGWDGVRVLRVLEACQRSLELEGQVVPVAPGPA
jgi:UDP-2-acetamido-3-amino-2,3-dideoxy-glucuronate N-acetyltransferase